MNNLSHRFLGVFIPVLRWRSSPLAFIRWAGYVFFAIITLTAPVALRGQNAITVNQVSLPKPFDHTEIKHMMLDDEGFLWFITNQGIWRFDGTDVEPVDIHNAALPQKAVPDNIYRYHHLLFFSIGSAAANRFEVLGYNFVTKTLNRYPMPGRPMNFMINSAGALTYMTTDGSKWTFSEQSGLKRADDYSTRRGWIKNDGMENYTVDESGHTYVFSHKKIGLITPDSVRWSAPITEPKTLAFVRWVYCSGQYIFAFSGNALVVYNKNTLQIAFSRFDETYNLSLPSQSGPVPDFKLVNNLRVQCYSDEPGTGKTLFGTDKGLLEAVPSFNTPRDADEQQQIAEFFKDKSVRSIYRSPVNNKLYVGTYQGHFVFEGKTFKELNNYVAYTMQPVNGRQVLVGMEGGAGFYILNTANDTWHINPNAPRTIATTKIIRFRDGFLTGASGCLYYLTPLPNGDFKVTDWFANPDLGIVKDLKVLNGEVWAASTEGLFKISGGQKQKIYPAGRTLGCYAIMPDDDGLWIGTNGEGLVKINGAGKVLKEIHFGDGLAGEYVYSLFALDKLVIAGTSGGISIFDRSSGMQALSIPDLPPSAGSLYQEFNHSALFEDAAKQRLIFGGTQGLTFLDEAYLKSVAGKPDDEVKLSYVKTGYNTAQPTATDIFVSGSKRIEISPENTFAGLKFSGPRSQTDILFRIPELDSKWQRRKLSDEVSLFALPPGNYTLQARFPSVTDTRYWLTKAIIVVPHFYQTLLFKLLIGLIIALLLYLAWLARIRKIRDEHLLRTTIASDLHDEIGSALTRISFSSELMGIKQQMDANVVEKISADSKGAIASISDIIWSVDARNDTRDDLLLRIREHAGNMLEHAAALHFDVQGLDQVTTLPQLVRQNIYLVFKEAINNIARHNASPEVWISLDNQHSGMVITIKNTVDAGKNKSAHTGQGLRNMQMRAKRIKATLEASNDGSLFTIVIKMRRW